ncbi:UDP-Gal betaGlcNAc beta 1,4- galactosyltransferase, polypeptide 4 [Cichlidogyrus casuarinus]|uniref:UDP-Gal betaGlcNAc beta 1,4-galactosyltransferase, polypeptide 4 n=1 Tax=Cichlidogyrus casuarinus TaxID=1844966 RepID=A0ABD2QM97_9PLAT
MIILNYSTKNYTRDISDHELPVLNEKGIENGTKAQPRILFYLNQEEAKAQKNWLKRKADPQKSSLIESQVDFMIKISTIVKLSLQEINEELQEMKGLPDKRYLDAIVEILEKNSGYSPTANGEWIPKNCETDKVLVLVPYRDRSENILYFLYYMHLFLQSKRQHYQIVLAEQLGSGRFRRANLFNSVVYELFFGTTKEKAVCLALHDIDKVPFSTMLNYTCEEKPLQICRELINADGVIVEKY